MSAQTASPAQGKILVEMWSDLICPWCGIGEKYFEQALRRFEHRDHIIFSLRANRLMPGASPSPVEDVMRDKYKLNPAEIAKSFQGLEEKAADVGLEYNISGSWAADTVNAHRLIKLAGTFDKNMPMYHRLFKAALCDKLPLHDADTLRKLALETGLPATDIDRVLSSDEFYAEVVADEKEMKKFGGRGVPFFVLNKKYDYSGALAPDVFLEALNKAWKDSSKAKEPAGGAGMVCGPDGCALP